MGGGYNIMQWAIQKSHESLGKQGELLNNLQVQGVGNNSTINGTIREIGAGGFGGGVKLSNSNSKDHRRNMDLLQRYLNSEDRKRRRQKNEKKKKKKRPCVET